MQHSTTYGPAIQYYLANDPRKANPFNKPHHRFVASDDPGQDALYLKGVQEGEINRFYVTITGGVRRNQLSVTVIDKHNDNVVLDLPVKPNTRLLATFGDLQSRLTGALDLLRSTATYTGAELRIDLATVNDDVKETLTEMNDNVVDANLFQEGYALARSGAPVANLWHDEQVRGWMAFNRSWSGNPQAIPA